MEKKIGTISILISARNAVNEVNALLSLYADIVYLRTGVPMREDALYIILLIVKSDADNINALTGKLGRLKSVKVKSNLIKSV
ncbi:MAG: hypothetical protein LBR36_06380 [Bacteroidales bacterium]|jgi:putative iron-only hydrogenase system regulator|nr:hypothetical protein [Bacteroidales bacterium]